LLFSLQQVLAKALEEDFIARVLYISSEWAEFEIALGRYRLHFVHSYFIYPRWFAVQCAD